MEHTDTGHENFKFSIPDENQTPLSTERFKFEPAIEGDEDVSAPRGGKSHRGRRRWR